MTPKRKTTEKAAAIGDVDVAALVRESTAARVEAFLRDEFSGEIQRIAEDEARTQIRAALSKRIAAEVPPYLDGLVFTPTNVWGEKKGEPETLREHVQRIVRTWLDEPLSYDGKAKGQDSYSWRASTTRGAWLVGQHIQYEMSAAIKGVTDDARNQLGQSIEAAFKLKLQEFMQTFTLGGKR